MAVQKLKISNLNQKIDVRLRTTVRQPDGSTKSNWDVSRFNTVANITSISSQQGYKEMVSEKETYYKVIFRFHPDRYIQISDQIWWGDKILKPVGDCTPQDFGDKRVFVQKCKFSAV